MSLKSDITKEYLEKYKETPTKTISKVIYKENKCVFNSEENVYTMCRYYRGSMGIKNRNKMKDRIFIRDLQKSYNPFALPESDEKEFYPFEIPPQYKKLLIFGDCHFPYHNVSALNRTLEYGKNHNIDSILLNGDTLDFHQLSVFLKDPRKRHFQDEIEMVKQFLDILNREFKNVKIFFKFGNHEERYENYLKLKAPELFGMSEFELDVILNFGERFIDVIKQKRTIKFGKLNILHGHELKGGMIPPVNAARGVFLKTKENTVVNHFHTDSKHSEPSLSGDHISCWSIGCMCELHPEYAVNNRWVHGFGIANRLDDEGNFYLQTKQIVNNKIV